MRRLAVHGVPRSGTTWLGSIFDSSPNLIYRHQPLFSYAFKAALSDNSSQEDIESFFEQIAKSKDDFIIQKKPKEAGLYPDFPKADITHVAYKEARYHHILPNCLRVDPKLQVVGIVRNPKSVISSWINAPKEFDRSNWSVEEEWRDAASKNKNRKSEYYGYTKWKEVTTMFLRLAEDYPDRFMLINYRDLLLDTVNQVQQLFEFTGLNMSDQTIAFIENKPMKQNNDPYSVYRTAQADNKWKKHLPEAIVDSIDEDLKGTVLARFNE